MEKIINSEKLGTTTVNRRNPVKIQSKLNVTVKKEAPKNLIEEKTLSDRICALCLSYVVDPTRKELELYLDLIKKCLPKLILTPEKILNKKVCANCIENLLMISNFWDRIYSIQNELDSEAVDNSENSDDPTSSQESSDQNTVYENTRIHLNPAPKILIKKEPVTFEEDEEYSNAEECQMEPPASERKCEILEVLDIKPDLTYDFMKSIGMASAMKVELSNEEEDCVVEEEEIIESESDYIGSYLVSHDHCYVMRTQEDSNSPWDNRGFQEVEEASLNGIQDDFSIIQGKTCNFCFKSFNSTKKMLIHKYRWHAILDYQLIFKKSLRRYRNPPKCKVCQKYFCPGHKKLDYGDKILISDILVVPVHEEYEIKEKYEEFESDVEYLEEKYQIFEEERIVLTEEKKEMASNEKNEHPPKETTKKSKEKRDNSQYFKCSVCFKQFLALKNLYQHKISHNPPSFKCSVKGCKKIFLRRHGLNQHYQREHLNQRKFNCPTCTHSYFFKNDMLKCRHSMRPRKKS